eukprot:UN09038
MMTKNNTIICSRVESNKRAEDLMRTNVVAMGMWASLSLAPYSVGTLKGKYISNSVSLARDIGKYVCEAKIKHFNPSQHLFNDVKGKCVFSGKIVNVERNSTAGFTRGVLKN